MGRRTIYEGLTRSEIAMLWGIWRHHVSKYCLEWEEAKDFILWAEKNGYIGGAKLCRHNESAPYSPDNCYWNIVPECFPKGHPCRECSKKQDCSTPCPERLRYWDDGTMDANDVFNWWMEYNILPGQMDLFEEGEEWEN